MSLDLDIVMQLMGRLGGTLKFFPSDTDARIGIAEEIASMASDEEQVSWLVSRLPKLHREWPGMLEVRALFCSKFKPKDGFDACSQVYVDGIPSETEALPAIAAPELKRLIGETVSAAASLRDFIDAAAKKTDLNRVLAGLPAPKIPEIPVRNGKHGVTQADVDKAAEELSDKKAREELKA